MGATFTWLVRDDVVLDEDGRHRALAIRLPSVLFGVVGVFLIFLFGRLESNAPAALLGAALLAFNGHQIYWSQIARPATLVSALGVLSYVFLFLATRDPAAGRASRI